MTWNFHKRIKIIPGVHLNLSKGGLSTAIGKKKASMPQAQVYHQDRLPVVSGNVFSADIHEITSQSMQGIKEAIGLAQQQRKELKNDLLKIQASLGTSKIKHVLSYVLLYGLIKKTIPAHLRTTIALQKEAIRQTGEQIDNCYVKLDVEFEAEIRIKYDRLTEAFKKLRTAHKIWDVTSAHFQDRIAARSSASTIVEKRVVKFAFKSLPDIKSDFEALYFENANGADLYFYPGFILMYSGKTNFAIIGLDEIDLQHSYVRFTETGTVPADSKVIDRTWAKVNKNGSPDRRFKGNYQIPVVRYGQIRLKTNTGLNEEYEFSNYEFTEEFGRAFRDYQAVIKRLK